MTAKRKVHLSKNKQMEMDTGINLREKKKKLEVRGNEIPK